MSGFTLPQDNNSCAFSQEQLDFFDAAEGAYSVVTDQEAQKSQITITGPETVIVEGHFGNDIHIGPKRDNEETATKEFYLYDGSLDSAVAALTVNYPKPAKAELQVYASIKQGFKPAAGDIWFIFRRRGADKLFIGYMSPSDWTDLAEDTDILMQGKIDIDDEKYQMSLDIASAPKARKLVKSMVHPRDFALGQHCLAKADFQCEADISHTTFQSKRSGRPYVEAHHLIPMSLQGQFTTGLDIEQNIVALCPSCHRAVHHATEDGRSSILEALWEKRKDQLAKAGLVISFSDFCKIYN